MRRNIGSRLTAGILALVLFPVIARAQDTPPPQEPAREVEEAPSQVESLEIVGEQIDATDVQDEAQAITAFSAEDLDRANIVNIDSLAYNVPGLHVGQSGQQAIVTLRGIGTENASITGEPGVAFHVDGVNFAQPSAARVAFFDLETLDVKRGPQGLQGGKNSTSGSINLVTNKPHDEYEVTGDLLFGNYDRVRARGAVNLPLGEFAATRLAFFHEDRDGFLDNRLRGDSHDPFDAEDFGLRTHLKLTPADSLEVLLTYNYFKQGGNGPQADLVPIPKVAPCQPTGSLPDFDKPTVLPFLAACNFDEQLRVVDGRIVRETTYDPATEDDDPRAIWTEFPSEQDNRFWGWTATVDWQVPPLPLLGESRLEAIGGFQRSETDFQWDFDGTDLRQSGLDTSRGADQNTAELRWSGNLAERVDWLAGGYFARETGVRDLYTPSLEVDVEEADTFARIDQTTENKAYGAFAHGTLHASDTVRFELGGRWIKERRRTWLLRERGGTPGPEMFVGCSAPLGFRSVGGDREPVRPNPGCTLDYRGTAWGAAVDWRPFGGDHLLYAKIDRGYKSGGFRAGARGEYVPEKIWAYALGAKSGFLDNRLQLNLEGFFYAYQDMQLVVIDGFSLRTENADSRMYGFDLEAIALPFPGLELKAILSHLKTEVRDYFSLDPADVFNTAGFDPSVDPVRVANYQGRRLSERERLENLAEEGRSNIAFADGTCNRKPPATGRVRCGDLGEENGLDDFSGNELSRSPEWKITLSAEYEIPLGTRYGTLTPRVQYTWQDDTYYRVFNKSFDLQTDYHLTDVKMIWRSPEARWEAEVFVTNIEDEAPKQNILIGSRGFGSPALAWYGPPRFYGVRVGFNY